ncbi:MAG: 4-hydroxy-tetrahydrodipicolinate synthase [Oscillospiraceae bacterium]|nr:4-hydroxy-tetrahydrodipicolinate synthase [Oscillospiraceae bacterium]
MKKPIFTGAGVAVITPMHKDGSVNYEELGKILDHQILHGTDSIVICGTTGEASAMPDEEHIEVIRYTCQKVAGRVPVIAGTGSNDTRHCVHLSMEAKNAGADALLQVTPYYNKTSQKGLIKHFLTVAEAVELPMILYNVPSRTGMNISVETYRELSKHPLIAGAKEASGNLSHVAHIAQACGDDLPLYSGNDDQIVPVLSLGGKGVISVLSNIAPADTHNMCSLYFEGKVKESLQLQLDYLPLIDALFCDVNPVPVKAAMNLLGWDAGECRLPLCAMEEDKIALLRAAMEERRCRI